MEQLLRLHDELDFADAAAAQLDVAVQFTGANHFVLDALLHRGHLAERVLGERAHLVEAGRFVR